MSWKMFGQIVLLILIGALLLSAVKCLHRTTCPRCKALAQKYLTEKAK